MRTTLIAVGVLLMSAACADAPITAGDIQADGQLRDTQSQQGQQSVLAASESNRPQAQHAEQLQVSGVLATEAEGALEDTTEFSIESEAIYLHLRADELTAPRPVTFVWIHGEQRRETMGFLQPSETLTLAASLPLSSFIVAADQVGQAGTEASEPVPSPEGAWSIEVYANEPGGLNLLFEREFEIAEATLEGELPA